MASLQLAAIFAFGALASGATPVISSVTNAASNTVASLPNSGIGQGSLFVVKGTGLGPAALALATSFPLTASIGGASVQVTVGGVSRDAIMYYSTATQLAAILPSSVPTGRGTVTASYNGSVSAIAPITVVRSTIGVYTVNQSGGGDAIATLGPALVGPLNAANPGDAVAFWATGLGPVSFNEANAAQQFDMTDIAVEAWVAGKPAKVLFRGRNACCTSTDVIYLEIPQGVGGCITPVVFKTGDFVSNTTSIPTAPSGRVCTPSIPTITSADVLSLLTKTRAAFGVVGLFRTNPFIGAELGIPLDGGFAPFGWFTPLPGGLGGTNFDMPHLGSCMVYSGGQFSGASLAGGALEGGSPITIAGPAGVRTLASSGPVGLFDAGGNFIRPGQFTVTAPAGAEVGAYAAGVTFVEPILQWANQSSLPAVDRAAGVTVTWTGGDPNGYVHVDGHATSSTTPSAGAFFRCTAKTSEGRFAVPSYVTLALPQSAPSVTPVLPAAFPASLWVIGVSKLTRFQATGLEWGLVSQWVNNARTVSYTGLQ
jgi:uncharacterized protein (TIGR03437 family)